LPELPDVTVYVEHLERRLIGARLLAIRVGSPHLLRTVEPAPEDAIGDAVQGVRRVGKRIAIEFTHGVFFVIHLMIAGRLQWRDVGGALGRGGVAMFTFEPGILVLTETGTRKRTSLHVVHGETALRSLDPGGLEPLGASAEAFRTAITRERHTLKRALTDPRLLSGIGNAYSDEILHRARLSPLKQTHQLGEDEIVRLQQAMQETLVEWTDRLRRESGERFPTRVTAFRDGMAVHGRFRRACPDCGAPIQRIVYAEHETNYCARCQTGGRVLADRALSRLLRDDFPRRLEDLEEVRGPAAPGSAGRAPARRPRPGGIGGSRRTPS
jgi:formamidopyrimidine-DNA glycosylase